MVAVVTKLPAVVLDLVSLTRLGRLLFRIHFVLSCPAKRPLQFQPIRPPHKST